MPKVFFFFFVSDVFTMYLLTAMLIKFSVHTSKFFFCSDLQIVALNVQERNQCLFTLISQKITHPYFWHLLFKKNKELKDNTLLVIAVPWPTLTLVEMGLDSYSGRSANIADWVGQLVPYAPLPHGCKNSTFNILPYCTPKVSPLLIFTWLALAFRWAIPPNIMVFLALLHD